MSFIIGICGGSGSGKTSFIRDIRKNFPTSEVCIISQDDYYKPREEQKVDENGVKNFDLPESINMVDFASDLTKLSKGETIQRVEYTFNNEKSDPALLTITPAPVIIVEGLFVFQESNLWNKMDLKIYIEAEESSQLIRRIKRDQLERNYPLDDVLYRYQHHVKPALQLYIAPFKPKVDLVINNNISYNIGLELLTSFIRSKINKETHSDPNFL